MGSSIVTSVDEQPHSTDFYSTNDHGVRALTLIISHMNVSEPLTRYQDINAEKLCCNFIKRIQLPNQFFYP